MRRSKLWVCTRFVWVLVFERPSVLLIVDFGVNCDERTANRSIIVIFVEIDWHIHAIYIRFPLAFSACEPSWPKSFCETGIDIKRCGWFVDDGVTVAQLDGTPRPRGLVRIVKSNCFDLHTFAQCLSMRGLNKWSRVCRLATCFASASAFAIVETHYIHTRNSQMSTRTVELPTHNAIICICMTSFVQWASGMK